jgi:hypothetical protein
MKIVGLSTRFTSEAVSASGILQIAVKDGSKKPLGKGSFQPAIAGGQHKAWGEARVARNPR